ncbi:hypothetical protein [Streptomyces venezuelae]|uniref:Uncharacterized protein n=1 Tax=Streptomyces venezuelae TaxID=54571 RepID=A0A5P2B6M0_STRVZ|nr:hypothetical protein [Streptomyces venezuelae]QES25906.1 hypothetical protein DEJ47_05040 [Streptomyces venezuelae]
MPSSSPISDREAAKARIRAKLTARHNQTAREYLSCLLHATNTHSEAEAILDTFERQSDTAARLNRVLDICDKGVRAGEELVDIDRIHAAALGDDVRQSGGGR